MEAGPLKHSSPAVSQSAQQQIIQETWERWGGMALGEKKDERLRFIRTENKGVHLSTRGCIIIRDTIFLSLVHNSYPIPRLKSGHWLESVKPICHF